jgi:hypothetical protein
LPLNTAPELRESEVESLIATRTLATLSSREAVECEALFEEVVDGRLIRLRLRWCVRPFH